MSFTAQVASPTTSSAATAAVTRKPVCNKHGVAVSAATTALAGVASAGMLTLYRRPTTTCPGLPWTVLADIGAVETVKRKVDRCGLSNRWAAVRGGIDGGHPDRPGTEEKSDDAVPAGRARARRQGRVQRVRLEGGDGGIVRRDGVFNDKLRADGYWVFAGGLQPASTATVVDGQGETPVATDGPYLETKEFIGGFWVIDVPDLDVAIRLAAGGSKACRGKVEVRPFERLA